MTTAAELNATLPYATPDELEWLRREASALPRNAWTVMIGAGPCVMALALLEGNPYLDLWVIDPQNNYCREHTRSAFPEVDIFYLAAPSQSVHIHPDREIHLLVVDGSHTYTDVLSDARVWLPLLGVEGYAFFHDYDADGTEFEGREQYPGVKQALNKYLRHQRDRYSFVGVVGTAAIVRRKA